MVNKTKLYIQNASVYDLFIAMQPTDDAKREAKKIVRRLKRKAKKVTQ